jgi:putative MATE family efflux protein
MQQVLSTSYRSILAVAMPLIIGNFIQSLVLITDMAFLSHLGDLEFDAAGNGGMVYITFYMIAVGLGDGMQIALARFVGKSDFLALRKTFQSGFMVLMTFAVLFFSLLKFVVPGALESLAKSRDIAVLQNDYLSIRSFSMFLGLASYGMMAFLLAVGKTKIVFLTSIVMSFVNIVGDYALVFGNLGFPPLGVEGAALASVLADLSTLLILIIYFSTRQWIQEYELFTWVKLQWTSVAQLFKLSWPLMIQGFTAMGTWTIFFIMIEQMGQRELEISQNIRAMYFLAFVPIFGFAAATKTYIGQLMGARNFEEIPKVQKRILLLLVSTVVVFFHGALLYPETLISLVNPRVDVVLDTAIILRQIFPAVLIFAFTTVYFNTISGSGNTKITLLIELICVGFYIIFAYIFIFKFRWSIGQVWYIEYIYFTLMALLSLSYLKFFDWKKRA